MLLLKEGKMQKRNNFSAHTAQLMIIFLVVPICVYIYFVNAVQYFIGFDIVKSTITTKYHQKNIYGCKRSKRFKTASKRGFWSRIKKVYLYK